MVPFLSFYSTRREGRYKKVRLKYPLSFNGDIYLDLREGEIDGPQLPLPTQTIIIITLLVLSCGCAHKCTSPLYFKNPMVHF